MKWINKRYVTWQSVLLFICLLFLINVMSLTVSNQGCADSFGQTIYRGLIENVWNRIEAHSMLSTYLQQKGYTSNDYHVKHACVNIASIKNNATYIATVQFTSETQNEYQYQIPVKRGTINQVPDIPVDDTAITVSMKRTHSETGKLILELAEYLKDHYHYQESDILSAYGSISDPFYSYSVIFKDEPYIRYNFTRKQTETQGNLHYQDYLLIKKSIDYTDVKHKFTNG